MKPAGRTSGTGWVGRPGVGAGAFVLSGAAVTVGAACVGELREGSLVGAPAGTSAHPASITMASAADSAAQDADNATDGECDRRLVVRSMRRL